MAEINFNSQAKNNGTPLSLLELFKDAWAELTFWKKNIEIGYVEIINSSGCRRHFLANKFWELMLREVDEKNGVHDIRYRHNANYQSSLYSRLSNTYFFKLILGFDEWFIYQYFPLKRCLISMLETHFNIFNYVSDENKQLHKMLITALKNSPPKIYVEDIPISLEEANMELIPFLQRRNAHREERNRIYHSNSYRTYIPTNLLQNCPTRNRPEFINSFQILNPVDHYFSPTSTPTQSVIEPNLSSNSFEMYPNTNIARSFPEATTSDLQLESSSSFSNTCSTPAPMYTVHMQEDKMYPPAGPYIYESRPPSATYSLEEQISSAQNTPYMAMQLSSNVQNVPYAPITQSPLRESQAYVPIPLLPPVTPDQPQNRRADFLYTAAHYATHLRQTNSNASYDPPSN